MLRENKESFPSYSEMLFNSNLDMQHTDVSISSCFASHLQPLSWCLLPQAGSAPHTPDLHPSKPDPRTEPSQVHVSMAGVKTRTPAPSADTCSVGCSDTPHHHTGIRCPFWTRASPPHRAEAPPTPPWASARGVQPPMRNWAGEGACEHRGKGLKNKAPHALQKNGEEGGTIFPSPNAVVILKTTTGKGRLEGALGSGGQLPSL